jgi:hypothetical protein
MENGISSAKKENMTWMAMTMVKMRELGAHSAWLLVPWKTLIMSPDWSSPRVLAEPGEVFSFFLWFRLRENVTVRSFNSLPLFPDSAGARFRALKSSSYHFAASARQWCAFSRGFTFNCVQPEPAVCATTPAFSANASEIEDPNNLPLLHNFPSRAPRIRKDLLGSNNDWILII